MKNRPSGWREAAAGSQSEVSAGPTELMRRASALPATPEARRLRRLDGPARHERRRGVVRLDSFPSAQPSPGRDLLFELGHVAWLYEPVAGIVLRRGGSSSTVSP